MMNRTGGVLISAVVLLTLVGCTPIGKMTHDMDAMIKGATTKADHEALAAHYEQEAKAMQDKAVEHRNMAQAYASGWARTKTALGEHCNLLATKYQEAANENLALAKQHHELAEAAPK